MVGVGTQDTTFTEVAEGTFAYVQRTGAWGWSNAGLIASDDSSLLVDTLFDLSLTRRMLDTMAAVTAAAPIKTVVNTHANGDHCYGNELVSDARIIASEAAAAEMGDVPPTLLDALVSSPGEVGDLFRSFFGEFDFSGITLTVPTERFRGRLELAVGGRSVELIELGPAHTAGDVIAWLPDTRTLFTGDLVFHGGAPIVWAGPLTRWIAACDVMAGLEPAVVVPGHGPVAGAECITAVREYLVAVRDGAVAAHDAGLDALDAAREVARTLGADPRFDHLSEAGRIAVNVDTAYRELDPAHVSPDVVELFRRMAALDAPAH